MSDLAQWLERIGGTDWANIDMGLSRMYSLVERLELSRPASKVITVAGTNGKGSTCVACETLLRHAGLKIGTTLSPHVSRFNERIRVDGRELDDGAICEAFAAVDAARGDIPLTYFEYAALAALWCFQKAAVDVAVLEIGLGGRLDAFNAIDADIAVITSIGLDHQDYLGHDRDSIGAEKAGILRPGQHVVLGPDMPASVLNACDVLHLTPEVLGDDWVWGSAADHAGWYVEKGAMCVLKQIPFGQCAPQNLLLGYLAACALQPIPVDALPAAALEIDLPGRLQRIARGERVWLLDVAHNPAGAQFLAAELKARGIEPSLIVCGMLADKDHAGVFEAVAKEFSAPWRLLDTHGARGFSGADLAAELSASERIQCCTWQALAREVNSVTAPGDVILVFGSFNVLEQFESTDIYSRAV